MNKKKMLSAATALTLLASPLAAGSADAASPEQVKTKVQTLQLNGNHEDLNKYIQDILSNYGVNGQNINFQDLLKGQAPQPQEAPKAETAAPEQEAPKAEAPAPAPQQEAPKAEAPAPAQPQAQEQQAQPQAQEQQAKPAAETGELSQYEQKVVELTNQERAKQGLPALEVDAELSKVAKEKSRDMQANNYFSHDSPTYGSPFDMMKQFGVEYSAAGENIAMGQPTPEEVVQAWMNSDGHRKNILSSNYTHIGVGYVEDGHYWTQQFISK